MIPTQFFIYQTKRILQKVCLSLAIPFLLLSVKIASGQNEIHKIKYSTINQVGLLTGEKGEAVMLQTINGIKKNKSFTGIGVGLDFYGHRSIPLFLNYRREFSKNNNTPYVYADAGINFLWLNFIQKEQMQFPSSSPGFYYDLGVGWKLSADNRQGFIISAGYSLKQVTYKVASYSIAPTPQMQSDNYDRYNFLYRRLIIKIGFQL